MYAITVHSVKVGLNVVLHIYCNHIQDFCEGGSNP